MTSLWGRASRRRPDPIARHVDLALATIAPTPAAHPPAPTALLAENSQLRAELLATRAQLRTTTATLSLRDEQAAYHRGLVHGLERDNNALRREVDHLRAELAVATPSVRCSGCGVTLQHGMTHHCVTAVAA